LTTGFNVKSFITRSNRAVHGLSYSRQSSSRNQNADGGGFSEQGGQAVTIESLLEQSKQKLDRFVGVGRLMVTATDEAVLGSVTIIPSLANAKVDEAKRGARSG
jgi:hypothetical protein